MHSQKNALRGIIERPGSSHCKKQVHAAITSNWHSFQNTKARHCCDSFRFTISELVQRPGPKQQAAQKHNLIRCAFCDDTPCCSLQAGNTPVPHFTAVHDAALPVGSHLGKVSTQACELTSEAFTGLNDVLAADPMKSKSHQRA